MIVYADVVIIVNFLTDYILLYLTAVFLYLNVKFRRLVISSFVGALSALVSACFFNGNTIIRLVFGTLTLLLICRVAYGKIKKIMMIKCVIAMLSFSVVLGGIVTFVYSQNSMLYRVGAVVLPICGYLLLSLYRKLRVVFSAEVKSERLTAVIEMFENEYDVTLLCDSGNLLIDPYTRLPVIVLSHRFDGCDKCIETRLVPVSTACGSALMKVITPKNIFAFKNGARINIKAAVGFSDAEVSFNGCDGIIPNTLANTV